MIRAYMLAFAIIICASVAHAQTSAPETKLPVPILAGQWSGEVDDIYDGVGDLDLTVIQKGRHLTGVWSIFFPDVGGGEGGRLVGTIKRNGTVAVRLKAPRMCAFSALGTIVSLDPISGEIAGEYLSCRGDSGTFDILR